MRFQRNYGVSVCRNAEQKTHLINIDYTSVTVWMGRLCALGWHLDFDQKIPIEFYY